MADTLTQLRTELVDALTPWCTVPVLGTVPATLVPPCNIVLPADPWVTGRDTFAGIGTTRWEIVCVAGTSIDQAGIAALEAQALDVLAAIDFTTATAPQRRQFGERLFLTLTITTTLTL